MPGQQGEEDAMTQLDDDRGSNGHGLDLSPANEDEVALPVPRDGDGEKETKMASLVREKEELCGEIAGLREDKEELFREMEVFKEDKEELLREVAALKEDREELSRVLKGENEELSKEIAALKEENDEVASSVKRLEAQVRDDVSRLEVLVREAEEKKRVVREMEEAREEVAGLRQEKERLVTESLAMAGDKERVEAALAVAAKNVSELSKKVDDAESAAAAAKEKVWLFEAEVGKLTEECRTLRDANAGLLATMHRLDEDLKSMASSKEALAADKEELLRKKTDLEEELEKEKVAVSNVHTHEQELENIVRSLRDDFAAASERESEQQRRIQQLGAQVGELEQKFSLEQETLQKERNLKAALQEQVAGLTSRKASLEEEVKQALSTVQKLQDITHKEQGQRRMLEDQVSTIIREKGRVEEAKTGVEAELKQLSSSSSKASVTAKAETLSLRQKIAGLESSLGRVKEEALSSEKKVWQLRSELSQAKELLERHSGLAKYAVPAAVVSTGALVATGVVGYFRFRQQRN